MRNMKSPTRSKLETDIKARHQRLKRETLDYVSRFNYVEEQISKVEKRIEEIKGSRELLERTERALSALSQKVLTKATSNLDGLVTEGLRAVFTGIDFTFKTSVERSRGRTALKFHLYQDKRSAPILEGYGGGVIAVVGLLLRISTIMSLNMRRVLILDETLAHLSPQYTSAASSLLMELGEKLGFEILLVTHTAEFAEYADRHYEIVQVAEGTKFKLTAGD